MSKDYHVAVRVKNGRIIRRMRELGMESFAELARRAGCSYTLLVQLAGMKDTPTNAKGEWRDVVLDISAVLKCEPEDLFNDQQLSSALKINSAEVFMDSEEIASLMSPGGMDAIEDSVTVQALLGHLSERERHIVETVSAGATFAEAGKLTEIGERWDVSGCRANQIYDKALRKMRSSAKRAVRHLPL